MNENRTAMIMIDDSMHYDKLVKINVANIFFEYSTQNQRQT